MKAGDPNYRIEPDDLKDALDESLIFAVAAPDGTIAYVNDRFCRVWQYRREELLGKNFRDFDSGSNPPAVLKNLRKTLRVGGTWRGEIRNLNAAGSFCWVEATVVPIRDEEKNTTRYIIVASDVTAHKQTHETLRAHVEEIQTAEEALRAQEDQMRAQNEALRASQKTIEEERAHYRELFDFAPAGYVITDVRGVILETNVGTEELLSATGKHLVGYPLIGFIHPQSRRGFRELLWDLKDEDSVRQAELYISRGAKEFWAAVSVSPVISAGGEVAGLRWLMRDVTEEKRRRNKLRETWERLNAVMQNAEVLIYVMDKDSRFVFINRRFEKVFDLISAEVQGKSVYDVFPKDYADFFTANNQKVLELQSAVEFEETAPLADGIHTYISLKIPQFDAAGNPITVFGISTDITERKRTEEALRESEKLMQLVLNASRIGIWTHDFVADRTIWSPENCRIFGVEKFDGSGATFWEMVDERDRGRVRRDFHRSIKHNCFYETEFRIVRPDGKKLWVRGQGQCEYDETGKPVRFLGTIQDINERRLAEQSAAENLTRFQNLVKISPYGVFINRITGDTSRIVYANEECLRIFGAKSPAEVIGKSNFDFLHPDYHEIVRQRISAMKDELRTVPPLEEKIIALDGAIVDVEITAAPIIEGGEATVLVTIRDITERKRREANLHFLAEITDLASRLATAGEIMNAVGSRVGEFLKVSHCQFMEIDEIRDEATLLARWHATGAPPMPDKVRLSAHITEEFRRLVDAGETIVSSDTLTNPVSRGEANAALHTRSFITVPFLQNGVWKYQLSLSDTHAREWREDEVGLVRELANLVFPRLERARAEEVLRASEEKFRLFVEHTPAAVAMFDREMRYLAVSNRFIEDYGFTRSEIIGRCQYDLFPQISEEWKAVHRRCLAGAVEKSDGERFVHADGRIQWLKWEARPWLDDHGEIGGIIIFGEDITELREASEKVRQSEEKFRQLSNSLPQLVWTCLPDGECDFLSRQWLEYTGVGEEFQLGYGWLEQLHPDDREATLRAWREVVQDGDEFGTEYRIRRHDGVYRLFDTRAVRLTDALGKTIKWVGSNTDVTDRKKTEDRLRIYEKIIVNARDAVLITESEPIDPPGPRIVYANPAFTEMTGYTNEEIVGKTPRLLQGPKTSRAKLDKIREALEKWEPVRLSLTNYRKDGSEFEVDFDVFPIADEKGWFINWISIQRDVTEQIGLERSIRDSAAKYRVLFEQNPYPVFVTDVETNRILAVNQSAVRLYGYSREELLKMTAMDILPPADVPDYFELMKKVRRTKAAHAVRIRHRTKSGATIDVELSSYAMNYEGRKARYVILQDVTERNRLAVEARREQLEKIEILESITEAFVSFDRRLRFIYVNTAAEKFLQKTAAELTGKSVREVFSEAVSTRATEEFGRVLATGGTEEFEIFYEPSESWLRIRAYPTPSGLSVFWQDITERKLSERLIQEKNQLLEQTYDAIFIWRIDDGIIYWNQNAEQLYGYTRQEAVGKNAQEMLRTVLPVPYEDFINQLKTQGLWEGELIHTTKSGEEVIVEGRLHVIKREEEAMIVLETLRDVTERRRIEARMARAAQLSLVGEFAAGLAHEIKNPLAGIKGVIDILLRRRQEQQFSDNSDREILENVGYEIERIDKTVRSLLQYSRPKPLEFKIAPLDETVRRAVQFAFHRSGFHASAGGEKITTALELPAEPLFIAHDPAKIEDAVLNLILNAEDAIGDKENGKITVRLTRTTPDDGRQGSALIEVADNGSGIAPENLTRIFAPFQTTKEDGTGLGLSSVRRVVRAHGGDCTVASTPGEGSVFTIRLPLNEKNAAFLEAYNR